MAKRSTTSPVTLDIAILILRVGVSLLMLTHGYSKLQKIVAGDLSFGDPLGLGEGLSLYLTVFAEFFCSFLLIFGFLTKPASVVLMFTMAVAAFIVHGNDGLAKQEKALLFLISYITLFLTGPGKFSFDQLWIGKLVRKRFKRR